MKRRSEQGVYFLPVIIETSGTMTKKIQDNLDKLEKTVMWETSKSSDYCKYFRRYDKASMV